MRAMIFVTGLAVVLAGPIGVGAQTSSSVNASPSIGRQAPVGHRQPTVQSVEKAQAEKGDQRDQANSRAPSVDLDKGLTICRGC
jgi:hypothetical protein